MGQVRLSMSYMNEYMDMFIEDMREHLNNINTALMTLEVQPEDKTIINELFRSFHTMKSSTAAMEFNKTSELIHKMEDLLFEVRENRIAINRKIVELIFVFHDFLENALEEIIKNGSEENLNGVHLVDTIKAILSNQVEENNMGSLEGYIDLQASQSDVDRLQKLIMESYSAYLINLDLDANSPFKSVRAWMAFEEIEKDSYIIVSIPKRPLADEFKDNSFKFEGEHIKVLVASKSEASEISDYLRKTLSEVSNINVTQVLENIQTKIEKRDIENLMHKKEIGNEKDIVDSIIGVSSNVNKVVRDLQPNYVRQVVERTQKLEAELGLFAQEAENVNYIKKIFRYIHTIKGLSRFIDFLPLYSLSDALEIYMNSVIKGKSTINNNGIALIKESVSHFLALCREYGKESDDDLLQKVDGLVKELKVQEEHESAKVGELPKTETEKIKNDKAEIDKSEKTEVKIEHATQVTNQSYLRIASGKVDNLVDLLGELMILYSLHKQDILVHTKNNNKIMNNLTRMERITKNLQDISMSMRMLSLKPTFQKLQRIVRDTAAELGKSVEFEIHGEETEIDRIAAEKLFEPLMHLVRNSVSHGIEEGSNRISAGKSAQGKVTISAYSKRGYVCIDVSDDGRGLSSEKIWKKAIEKNLVKADAKYSEDEILKLIFIPGFSTQENINNISGRGVGMNVIETEVNKLGGKVEISNYPGKGCTFTIKIPINLATINGTIVDIFGGRYIIPTLNIKEFFKPSPNSWISIAGKRTMVGIRNDILQMIDLSKYLGVDIDSTMLNNCMIVVVELDQKLLALPVKTIVDKQEIVVKSLGDEFRNINYASGATVLGDGKVSLILDIEALFRLSDNSEGNS